MKDKHLSFVPSDASLTGFASNVTGALWTLTSTSIPDGLAHQVSIRNDSITDHSGKTATLVGTDANGHAQTEVMALPGPSATVESTSYFKTLTSVTPSATIGADTMDIGWVDEFASQTIPLDPHGASNGVGLTINVTGTINYTIQMTNSDIYAPLSQLSVDWMNSDDPAVVAATTDKASNFVQIPLATRFVANSYSSGASAKFDIVHNGLR